MHNGDVDLAKEFVSAAAQAGVDAVKFQTHIFDAESLPDAPAPSYFSLESRKQYFERTAFSKEQWIDIKEYCESLGVEFMSSPFSLEAVDLLDEIGMKRFKIPSGEVTNHPLLEKAAATGRQVILSSGMSSWTELDAAVKVLRDNGCEDLCVMQCSSVYPCPPEKVGLNVLFEMKQRYGCALGLSDHTMGNAAAVLAAGIGVVMAEKHFVLSSDMHGSDAGHSIDPEGLKNYVLQIREAEKILNCLVDKDVAVRELSDMKYIFEKSIVAACDIEAGTVIEENMLAFKKPGDGIRADEYKSILGRKLNVRVNKNTKIQKEMVDR